MLTTLEGNTTPFDFLTLQAHLKQATPLTSFQYVEVTFAGANVDFDIKHALKPTNSENIHYIVVRKDRSTDIYHDQSGTRRAWGKGYIVLRSSVANAKVTLLIFTPRTA